MGVFDEILAAALTISILSFLYRPNIAHTIAESIAVGLSVAVALISGLQSIQSIAVYPIMQGELVWFIPVILGAMLYLTYLPRRIAYFSRWPLALMIGTGLGLGLQQYVWTDSTNQIITTLLPIVGGNYTPLDNIIIIVGTFTALSYFLFTEELTGRLGVAYKYVMGVGRIFMMIAFGALLGGMILQRYSEVINSVLSLTTPTGRYLVPVVVVGYLVYMYWRRQQPQQREVTTAET